MTIDENELSKDLNVLCQDIGERLAGGDAERRAAHYVADRFRAAGVARVQLEEFPCTRLRKATAEVFEPNGRNWKTVESLPLVGSPSTPGGLAVEGSLVWVILPEGQHRLKPNSLKGTIAVVFGGLPTSPPAHRQLVAANPAAIVHVDDRLPFPWAKSDGTIPYLRRLGQRPTVSVSYMDAWRWRREGVSRLKVRLDMDHVKSRSVNVIAELPGTEPRLPAVVLTSHIDTQPGNCGADDNAGGVGCVLALARALTRAPLKRTLRFIAFGAEEQLSVGATHHVRKSGIGPADVGLVLNFDSTASLLGHYVLWLVGDERLSRSVVRALSAKGIDVVIRPEISPYCDGFPFNRAGIPSVWFRRQNFPGGKWQHHCSHDNLENISIPQLAALLEAILPWARRLSNAKRWPFAETLGSQHRSDARRLSKALLGW